MRTRSNRAAAGVIALCASLVAIAGMPGAALAAGPVVRTASGPVEGVGKPDAPGPVFLGVPYAAAPVGQLRWAPPQPPARWTIPRNAGVQGAGCIQMGARGVTGSEDCLYLNIWVPASGLTGRAPVMLWSFGGANVTGSANSPGFDGGALARHGVVVVTANYRTGVMGFLAHPALSAQSPDHASGNYMLMDQIAVLRWIRRNIAAFGGDPGEVTLFGQSSGSYDTLLLMTSPLARGLFHRAIAQSGQFLAYGGPMPRARAEAIGGGVAADLGLTGGPDVIARLRALPAEQVIAAAIKRMPTQPGSDTGLLTVIDGYVLPRDPARVFASGRQMPIPLMIGNNAREIPWAVPAEELRGMITRHYGDLAPRALAAYGLDGGGTGRSDAVMGGPGAQWWTDVVQRCPAMVEAGWHAAAGRPTFHYQFERTIPGREAQGATHGAEVAFVFGNLDKAGPPAPPFTAQDRAASALMQAYWTNFAKTGDPNRPGLPLWPRAGQGDYLAFTMDGAAARRGLPAEPCGVYREWAERKLKQ